MSTSLLGARVALARERSNGEFDLAVGRVVVAACITMYVSALGLAGEKAVAALGALPWHVAAYGVAAVLLNLVVLSRPRYSPRRAALGLMLDHTALTYLMVRMEADGAAFFALYLMAVAYHGLRFSPRLLLLSSLWALGGFAVVAYTVQYWRDHLSIAFGVGTSVVLIAVAVSNLTRRLSWAYEALDRQAADMKEMVSHDSLTGLATGRLLVDLLRQAMVQTRRSRRLVALVYFDLDGFRHINENLGVPAGDRILMSVSKALRGRIRDEDTFARLGGDEFAIILPSVGAAADAERVATIIVEEVARIRGDQEALQSLAVSVGIVVYPTGAMDANTEADDLIRRATDAMHHARRASVTHIAFDPRSKNAVAESARADAAARPGPQDA